MRRACDRLEPGVAVEVGGEGLGRRVAIGGIGRERLGEDRIEIAGEGPGELRWRHPSDARGVRRVDARGGARRRARRRENLQEPRRPGGGIERPPAGEQLVQEDGERIDVGGDGHRRARQLLRSGVVGSGDARAFDRELGEPGSGGGGRIGVGGLVGLEELGDSEVEELDRALGGHQDVRGLEVAMDDQAGVGGMDGRGHLADELDPDREGVLRGAAGLGDRHAGDPLEGEVRAPVRRHSGVEELRDVRMAEGRQNVAFAAEAALHRAPGEMGVRQLEGDLAFVGAVAPGGEPDDPHPAAPELAHEGVGADAISGERPEVVVFGVAIGFDPEGACGGDPRGAFGVDPRGAFGALPPRTGPFPGCARRQRCERVGREIRVAVVRGEHRAQIRQELAMLAREPFEPGRALGWRTVEREVEQARELRPEPGRAGQPGHA